MSRKFDYGRENYGNEHRSHEGQQTKHYLAHATLQHYGAKPENYREFAEHNYRMGSRESNTRDRLIDNALIGEYFRDEGPGYDAQRLAAQGISYGQQLQAIGKRFNMARGAYETTGEYKYYMMQKDLRDAASTHLDGDLRGFHLSKNG